MQQHDAAGCTSIMQQDVRASFSIARVSLSTVAAEQKDELRSNAAGHNYIGHNYIGHDCIGHNYKGHNYKGHSYIGHNYLGHK